jgi:hypothetical protein
MPGVFLTRPEFIELTEREPYFRRMTRVDLCARSIDVAHADWESYLAWYQAHTLEWEWWERIWMLAIAGEAERRMRSRGLAHMVPKNSRGVSWRFAKVARRVEMGFPHTFEDVIVWSEDTLSKPFWEQVELAVHEAVHIWQRRHPDETRAWHKKMGYSVVNIAPSALRRNNPDADEYIWQKILPDGDISGQSLGCCYRSHRPSDLTDVEGVDHPNELQAYLFASRAMS